MNEERARSEGKPRKSSEEKLLALPGLSDAIELVEEHAWVRASIDAIVAGKKGQLGDKARHLIIKATPEAENEFFDLGVVEAYCEESFDAYLEYLSTQAGPKIAELWGLSETAGQYLPQLIYWRRYSLQKHNVDFTPILLISAETEKYADILRDIGRECRGKRIELISSAHIQSGHIYLDVTELPRDFFRQAYSAINLLRKYLGIQKNDLQAGTPRTMDAGRALEAIHLKNIGEPSKNIATQLGFKVYTQDVRSGSYPLLLKYLKLGRELEEKLAKLDKFLTRVPDVG
jgi:hypothetical protein